jgi:hypothetical protein
MKLSLEVLTDEALAKVILPNNLPFWADPNLIESIHSTLTFVCRFGDTVAASWLLPYEDGTQGRLFQRRWRAQCYCAPIFHHRLSQAQRFAILDLFARTALKEGVSVVLPMAPHYVEVQSFQLYGAIVEHRHTHEIWRGSLPRFSRVIRNHIHHARRYLQVDSTGHLFDFTRAITGEPPKGVAQRAELALDLIRRQRAEILTALRHGGMVAQILIAYDLDRAYLLHSWRDSSDGCCRGAITLLISEALSRAFRRHSIDCFDFEGSVIEGVDRFFRGFSSSIACVPFVYMGSTPRESLRLYCEFSPYYRLDPI